MAFFKRNKFTFGSRRKPIPDGVWMKCDGCGQTLYRNEVEENLRVCPSCGHHYRIDARTRIRQAVDQASFEETWAELRSADPLAFSAGGESYADRLDRAREQSGLNEALVTGIASIEGTRAVVGAMDSGFIMASMGSALGEKFCRAVHTAIETELPLVVFAASGGARMQEGILALMQMAKTANAVREMNEAGLPYIVVLTDPTSGGVFASFASLGDIVIAEPNAYIGFAGARLIEGALRVKLPDGFQRAEYQFENGFVDAIVPRHELRPYLGRLLRYLARPHAILPPEERDATQAEDPEAEAPEAETPEQEASARE